MSYDYKSEKIQLLGHPANIAKIVKAHEAIKALMKKTDAITYGCAINAVDFFDSWQAMACLDYLVELGFFYKQEGLSRCGQDQILTPVRRTA